MKVTRTYIFIINFLVFGFITIGYAQTDSTETNYKQRYGIRFGADVSKPIRSLLDKNYTGLELIGDYRFSKRFYIAGEIGTEKKITDDELINFETSGSYIKLGVDYNAYENWLDMQNSIYVGLRYGFSTFKHTINSFSIYNTDDYWDEDLLMSNPSELSNLNAHWLELQLGIKVEVFQNLFVGANVQLKRYISQKEPDNFANLYIPSFGKTTEGSNFGVGYGYTISYLIPFYKK